MEELGRPNSCFLVKSITVNVENGFFQEITENINRALGSKLQAWSHGVTQARLFSRSYLFTTYLSLGLCWKKKKIPGFRGSSKIFISSL